MEDFVMLRKSKLKNGITWYFQKERGLFKPAHGPFWSAKEVCKVLEIEDADKAIAELDPDDKFEEVVKEGMFKKPRKKIVALNWTGLSSLLFRSQTAFAKKFQRFVNNYIFFDMFLHVTPYFEERYDWDENCMEEYGSILNDLEVNLGVWAD
jgi:hypothetical protein